MLQRTSQRIRLVGSTAALLLLLAPMAAYAEKDNDVYSREGGYVGLMGVVAWDTQLEDDLGGGADVDMGYGFNGRAGWRSNPWFAFELQSEFIVEFDVSGTSSFGDYRLSTTTTNFKVPIPLGIVEPYALVGLGFQYFKFSGTTDNDDVNFATRFGAGVDIYANKNWVVSVEGSYVLPAGDISGVNPDDLDYVSVGIGFLYRLDGPTL